MAADGVNEMKLVLVEADKTYPMNLRLSPCEVGGTICVRHVASEIEKLTQIKKSNQRIIFKGRELFDENCILSMLGVRDGNQIHVLKKQYDPDVVKPEYKIDLIEKRIWKQDEYINALIHRFDVMQKELVPYMCSCTNIMELKCSAENCQRGYEDILENLNSIQIEDEMLVKKKQKLLCRIEAKLRCSGNLIIAINDVLVRMTF